MVPKMIPIHGQIHNSLKISRVHSLNSPQGWSDPRFMDSLRDCEGVLRESLDPHSNTPLAPLWIEIIIQGVPEPILRAIPSQSAIQKRCSGFPWETVWKSFECTVRRPTIGNLKCHSIALWETIGDFLSPYSETLLSARQSVAQKDFGGTPKRRSGSPWSNIL